MNPRKVPKRWFDTLEMAAVVDWLSDENFPIDTAENMVTHLRHKRVPEFNQLLIDKTHFPQSFVHWWCHMRVARRINLNTPAYAHMDKWLPRVMVWKKKAARPEDVIGTFKIWLDILFLDVSMYEDETHRPRVPRRVGDDIQWDGESTDYTRVDTIKYIMDQGLAIFKERGWKDGASYWKRECKKYLSLFT